MRARRGAAVCAHSAGCALSRFPTQSVSQSFFAIATRPPSPLPSGNRHTDIRGEAVAWRESSRGMPRELWRTYPSHPLVGWLHIYTHTHTHAQPGRRTICAARVSCISISVGARRHRIGCKWGLPRIVTWCVPFAINNLGLELLRSAFDEREAPLEVLDLPLPELARVADRRFELGCLPAAMFGFVRGLCTIAPLRLRMLGVPGPVYMLLHVYHGSPTSSFGMLAPSLQAKHATQRISFTSGRTRSIRRWLPQP